MSSSDPVPAVPRRTGLLLALSGALVGAGAAVMGAAAWRRKQPADELFSEETGRGLPATPPSPQAARKGFETEDMSGAVMGALTVGLGVAIAGSIWLMVLMMHSFQASRQDAPPLTAQQQATIAIPLPHLQANPYLEIDNFRHGENDRLDRYSWTDPQHLRARVPLGIAIGRTVGQSLDSAP